VSPTFTPNALNTTYEGVPAYNTSDLLQEHPTMAGYWRVYGRSDDQLMLSTGEKVCLFLPFLCLAPIYSRLDESNPPWCATPTLMRTARTLSIKEGIISQNPLVHASVIFGRGRDQNGVLIQPTEPFEATEESLAEFRNKIWSVIKFSS